MAIRKQYKQAMIVMAAMLLGALICALFFKLGEQKPAALQGETYQLPVEDILGLPELHIPEDNPLNMAKVALGRKLFMDRRLSHNNTISCAMCHVPEQGFTVNELARSVGIEGRSHRRNAPTVVNAAFMQRLFHDGREPILEDQVIDPIVAFNEMGNPAVGYVVEKVSQLPDYDGMFEAAFGGKATLDRLTKAIAAYERTLVSGNSRFDRYMYGGDKQAMTASEINGMKVFAGRGRCIVCHTMGEKNALFTDQQFHNTGIGYKLNNVPYDQENNTMPIQLAPGIIVEADLTLVDEASEAIPNDVGRFEITENPDDRWAYKTPTLRNVALTAPYMHDGSLMTLEDVVEFYDKGGEENPLLDPLLKPLRLTAVEKQDLVAFMKALTGSNMARLAQEARAAYYLSPVERP